MMGIFFDKNGEKWKVAAYNGQDFFLAQNEEEIGNFLFQRKTLLRIEKEELILGKGRKNCQGKNTYIFEFKNDKFIKPLAMIVHVSRIIFV